MNAQSGPCRQAVPPRAPLRAGCRLPAPQEGTRTPQAAPSLTASAPHRAPQHISHGWAGAGERRRGTEGFLVLGSAGAPGCHARTALGTHECRGGWQGGGCPPRPQWVSNGVGAPGGREEEEGASAAPPSVGKTCAAAQGSVCPGVPSCPSHACPCAGARGAAVRPPRGGAEGGPCQGQRAQDSGAQRGPQTPVTHLAHVSGQPPSAAAHSETVPKHSALLACGQGPREGQELGQGGPPSYAHPQGPHRWRLPLTRHCRCHPPPSPARGTLRSRHAMLQRGTGRGMV